MQTAAPVKINKPGSDFHGMSGEVIRTVPSLDLTEVCFPRQKMNPATSTRNSSRGPYVSEWRGGSWMFSAHEIAE